jgi:hypothetical protein
MNFTIENLAPDTDVVHMTFGEHPDSLVTVTVSREANGEVCIHLVDNLDGGERRIVLGQAGYTDKI